MNTTRIVHIGFQKTASSFLQSNVFPNCKNYQFIDFLKCKRLAHKILLEGIGVDIDSIRDELPDGNIIFSYEGLSGSFFTGIGINSIGTAGTLKNVGFNKVIIVLRRDRDKWIKSIHNQYVKGGGRLTFRDFLSNPDNVFQMRQWFPEMIDFSNSLIDEYIRLFGSDNVLILFSEDIYGDSNAFKLLLEKFMMTDIDLGSEHVNESIPGWAAKILIFTNHFTTSQLNPTSLFSRISNGHIKRILFGKRKKSFHKF